MSELLDRVQAARYLCEKHSYSIKPSTLAFFASRGGGPVFVYCGRYPRYRPADLDAWMASKLTNPVRNAAEGREARKRIKQTGIAPQS
jgi:hypothetical protein